MLATFGSVVAPTPDVIFLPTRPDCWNLVPDNRCTAFKSTQPEPLKASLNKPRVKYTARVKLVLL